MNLLDPRCGMDPEERRDILLHTDIGRLVIAAEDAVFFASADFDEGLPPGFRVDSYRRGPKKGMPCLRKGNPGDPDHEVRPLPEGHEVGEGGQLQRREASSAAAVLPPAHLGPMETQYNKHVAEYQRHIKEARGHATRAVHAFNLAQNYREQAHEEEPSWFMPWVNNPSQELHEIADVHLEDGRKHMQRFEASRLRAELHRSTAKQIATHLGIDPSVGRPRPATS